LEFTTPDATYPLWNRQESFERYIRRYMEFDWDNRLDQALSLAAAGDHAAAIPAVHAAISENPLVARGYALLHELLIKTGGSPDEILAAIQKAVNLAPGVAHYRFIESALLARSGRLQDAAEAARQCVQLDPSNDSYYRHLSDLLVKTGDLQGAIAAIRESISLAPAWPGHQKALAHLLRVAGDDIRAVEADHEAEALEFGVNYGIP
jgi:tetratricopeptide (TPR) repeat protein